MDAFDRRLLSLGLASLVGAIAIALTVEPVLAHGGSLGAEARESVSIPSWLFLLTGGAVVGASFLLASFVTDRRLIGSLTGWRYARSVPFSRGVRIIGQFAGLEVLATVIVVGCIGPQAGLSNLGVLLVWVGWWAGYTASTYLIGDTWPTVNPWRTLSRGLPSFELSLPAVGAWPSVVGLLVLVWIEVVSPLADAPTQLAIVVSGYTLVTLLGTVLFGTDVYFERIDPVTRVFRYYGRVAPIAFRESVTEETDDAVASPGVTVRGYGVGLGQTDLVTDNSEVAFVVALLWATTYDGLVATPTWRTIADPVVTVGFPAHLLYPLALAVGFFLFLSIFRVAARLARTTGETYLETATLARLFAPPLVAIAAGYHLAHYLGYFLSLVPTLLAAVGSPMTGLSTVPVYAVPNWFGAVPVASVLAGHVLAIWVAHTVAFEQFPGRMQAIRSQYPFIAVMVLYTTVSLWLVTQPSIQPPYL